MVICDWRSSIVSRWSNHRKSNNDWIIYWSNYFRKTEMPMTVLRWSNTQFSSLNMINESNIEDFWVFTIEIQYNASNNMMILNNQIKQIAILVRRNATHESFEQRKNCILRFSSIKEMKRRGRIGDNAEAMRRWGLIRDDTEVMRRRQRRRETKRRWCADDNGDDAQTMTEMMRRRYTDDCPRRRRRTTWFGTI